MVQVLWHFAEVFGAVANIVQLLIMMGHTPFDVEYRDT